MCKIYRMKKWPIILAIMLMGIHAQSQIVRAFTPRYTNTSVKGNIVYVGNSILTTHNVTTGVNEVPPGGTSSDNGGYGVYLDVDNSVTTLFNYGQTWKYWDVNTRPANWETTGFSDVGWPSAAAQFGWGQASPSPNVTCMNSGCATSCPAASSSCGTRTPAYYFRQTFNITTTGYTAIRLNMKRNDGVVIYINGTERVRNNMPAGAIAHLTYSTIAVNPGTEELVTVDLSPSYFVNGNNLIAVEIHSDKAKANDVSWDLQIQGVDDKATFSSTTADLALPSCSQVLFAGLYWGGDEGSSGTDSAWITSAFTSCKIKIPGATSYTTVTASQWDRHSNLVSPALNHTGYTCFKDITSMLNTTSPNGTYTVADVVSPANVVNSCAGWTIVIVYANNNLTPRNLSVFDGHAIINSGDTPVDVTVSGFLTPASGIVSCELGAVVYDGDRGSGDAWKFKQNGAGSYYDLATTTIPLIGTADAWNSVVAYKGTVVTTRNPAYNNTLGYDSKIIDLPNTSNAQLGNNQTSAIVQFSSAGENYFVQVVTTSITQFNPAFSLQKTSSDLNGGSLAPGDILRYTISYNNVGNDGATSAKITDYLPVNVGYVPGSLKINGVAKTDAAVDDQADFDAFTRKLTFRLGTGANGSVGGTLAANASGTVTFDVYIPSSCRITSCYGAAISNNARIDYAGATTSQTLYDSSSYNTGSGCYALGAANDSYTASCYIPADTTLVNICPSTSIALPWLQYAGYTFFSGIPFSVANVVAPGTMISSSGVYYAYFNSGTGCSDTVRINVLHQNCPDLDEEDDGIPDYVELNIATALQDADGDGIANWYDLDYPGRVDNNSDNLNDNFDPGADSDNDGVVNFMDTNWAGYIDSNGDAINDNFDKDKDGIPDFLDRDSDNDGIPDTVESYGVDANGNGVIDNFSDADSDGLSQNVDATSGVINSGNGLGAVDTDSDGVPNYLDLDSDNDGIPDVIEVYGTDANNNGRLDVLSDSDLDGLLDAIDGDVGNDGTSENAANALLITGTDGNGDGRADSYPNKNIDSDSKSNPYDLDSDGDGITDVKESPFTDADYNGRIDGTFNSDGWSTTVAALGSLGLPNTDASGRANPFDIDSDNDGIPDNVEGMTTTGYILPSAIDTDLDGIENNYDNFSGFGGDGIHPVDKDGDTQPDYLDSDTDSDGLVDIIEGNDLNLNGLPDDLVTLTGLDTDGDGLDNRFDNNNSTAEATSAYMGNGGSLSGDVTPGSITTVQRTAIANSMGCSTERDWRCVFFILSCDLITFKAALQTQTVILDWTVFCKQEADHFVIERSTDGILFTSVSTIAGHAVINENESYQTADDVSSIPNDIIYYRLRSVMRNGRSNVSHTIMVRRALKTDMDVLILPNPVHDQVQVLVNSPVGCTAFLYIMDATGRVLQKYTEKIQVGSNTLSYPQTSTLPTGSYYLRIQAGEMITNKRFNVIK
jgi:uncharacterized repeat protein (TIGR01451 family)